LVKNYNLKMLRGFGTRTENGHLSQTSKLILLQAVKKVLQNAMSFTFYCLYLLSDHTDDNINSRHDHSADAVA
jgi:hypothetical protein